MDLDSIWQFLNEKPAILAAILTFVLTVSWQLFSRVIAPRPKLTWGVTNNNIFGVPYFPPPTEEDPQPAPRKNFFYARNVWLWNAGTAGAEKVEITFNWKPEHIEWFPHYKAEETRLQNDRYMLSIEQINPKTGLSIAMLSANNELPDITGIWAKGYNSKRIEFLNQRRYSKWVNFLILIIMLLGMAAAIYLFIIAIQFLASLSVPPGTTA